MLQFLVCSDIHSYAENIRLAIPALAPARLAPAAGAKVLFEIPAGTAVRVREVRGAWLRVLLPDGSSGWIPEPL